MKHTFTLIALAVAASAHSQVRSLPQPRSMATVTRFTPLAVTTGTDAILRAQQSGSVSRSTGTSQRLTAWSRRDLDRKELTDSSSFAYSGSRGSRFADEGENLWAGTRPDLSNPDLYINGTGTNPQFRLERAFTYDAADRVTDEYRRSGRSASRYQSGYNAAGKLVSILESDSGASGWTPAMRCTIRYNAAGQRVSDSVVMLPGNEPVSLVRYHYNAGGLPDSLAGFTWEMGTNSWNPEYLVTTGYTPAGKTAVSTSFYIDVQVNVLQPMSRDEYTYTPAGLLGDQVSFSYEDNNWVRSYRDAYTYSGAKTLYTGRTTSYWDEDKAAWDDQRAWSYTLNAQGRWTQEIFSQRISGALRPTLKTTIHYNAAGLVESTWSYPYDAVQGTYRATHSQEDRFYYEPFQTTRVSSTAVNELRMFPNPASGSLSLNSRLEIVQIGIYSAAGGLMSALPGNGARTLQLDVAALPAGIYVLQVQLAGGAVQAQRFVKQ